MDRRRGPAEWPGPFRRDKPVLIPMYAELSQRPPPPRPFLNLLRSPVHLPLRRLVRALTGLSTVVVGAFSNTHHRDLSSLARHACRARPYGTDLPPATNGHNNTAVPFRESGRRAGAAPGERPVHRRAGDAEQLLQLAGGALPRPMQGPRWGCCFGLSVGCLPRSRPLARATFIPLRVLIRARSASHSAIMVNTLDNRRPPRICRVAHRTAEVRLHRPCGQLVGDRARIRERTREPMAEATCCGHVAAEPASSGICVERNWRTNEGTADQRSGRRAIRAVGPESSTR
jgi:hypothetical protein